MVTNKTLVKCATYSSKCPIFLYFCLFVLPYEIREKIFEGTPPLAPPVLKNQAPPPAEKKIGPPPLGFWSLSTYVSCYFVSIKTRYLSTKDPAIMLE